MRGLSASMHRFQFPSHSHFRLSMSWAVRDDLPVQCSAETNRWLTGSSLQHFSVLVFARIHLHRRTQPPNEWLHECCFVFPSDCEMHVLNGHFARRAQRLAGFVVVDPLSHYIFPEGWGCVVCVRNGDLFFLRVCGQGFSGAHPPRLLAQYGYTFSSTSPTGLS